MRFFLRILLMEAFILAIIFTSAGRYDLPWCWALVAVHALCVGLLLSVMEPGLREERVKPAGKEHDRWLRLALVPTLLGHLIVAGLDLRWGWSGEVSPLVHVVGLVAMAS